MASLYEEFGMLDGQLYHHLNINANFGITRYKRGKGKPLLYALEVNGGEVTDYLDRDSMIKALKFATVVLQLIIDYKEEERNA